MQASKSLLRVNLLQKCIPSQSFLHLRKISVSSHVTKSFKIQDEKDFDERVKKSKTPVIVDFFAT